MSRAVLALVLLLLLPASASAQTNVPLAGGAAGECLADAGGGRIALLTESGGRLVTELRDAALGIEATVTHAPGLMLGCPAVAAADSGAAIVATSRLKGRRSILEAAFRAPGGGFGTPAEIASERAGFIAPAVAVAPDGSAIVAWVEFAGGRANGMAVRVVRRPADGPFGPIETVSAAGARRYVFGFGDVHAAMDAVGRATVAWVEPASRKRVETRAGVRVATAAPGAAFGALQALKAMPMLVGFDLAVAPDGRALVAQQGLFGIVVHDRAPGGAFARAARFGTGPGEPAVVTVALAADRSAIVAWASDDGAVFGATRPGGGEFGSAQRIGRARTGRMGDALGGFARLVGDNTSSVVPIFGVPFLHAAVGPAGRAAVAWRDAGDGAGSPIRGRVVEPGGTPGALGGPVRDVEGVLPLLTPAGAGAIWLDNRAGQLFHLSPAADGEAGRLHRTLPGNPQPPGPAPPAVTVTALPHSLYHGESLPLTVHCSAACEVRATIAARTRGEGGGPPLPAIGVGGRDDAGDVRLEVEPGLLNHIAPPPPGSSSQVPVVVTATAPGGTRTTVVEQDIRVTRRPIPPLLRPIDVRAVRRGDDVVVTWRTRRAARRQSYFAESLRRERRQRGDRIDVVLPPTDIRANGRRTRYRKRLEDVPARHRFVRVTATAQDPPGRSRAAVAPITG